MSYYPPSNQGPDYSVSYSSTPNQGRVGFNTPYGDPPAQFNVPAFPVEPHEMSGGYPPTGQYLPPGQYPPPEQYPPPGQYPPSGPHHPPGQPGYDPNFGIPVINQPGPQSGGDWMNTQGPPVPPGLEMLMPLSHLFVKQKVEILEAITSFETSNKYVVKDQGGQKILYAREDSDWAARNCCKNLRPFEMIITDNMSRELIRLSRPLKCDSCCFPCCLQEMEVYSPPGNLIGTIEQEWSLLTPTFKIKEPNGNTVFNVRGPICRTFCWFQSDFEIFTAQGDIKIGQVSREFSNLVREFFTDADYFAVSFPSDLDVKMKAVLLGLLFLIDFMYYEST